MDFAKFVCLGCRVIFICNFKCKSNISGSLPHKHKIVIAGNHELGFEDGEEMSERQLAGLNMLGINKAYELLSNCTYLCDKSYEAYGLKIYGAPWHSMPGYSFFRQRGQKILHKWNQIPAKIDVLMTHTPPLGHGDFNAWDKMDGILCGCAELLNTVEQRVKPKYHVFGHVHQVCKTLKFAAVFNFFRL